MGTVGPVPHAESILSQQSLPPAAVTAGAVFLRSAPAAVRANLRRMAQTEGTAWRAGCGAERPSSGAMPTAAQPLLWAWGVRSHERSPCPRGPGAELRLLLAAIGVLLACCHTRVAHTVWRVHQGGRPEACLFVTSWSVWVSGRCWPCRTRSEAFPFQFL